MQKSIKKFPKRLDNAENVVYNVCIKNKHFV